MPVRCFRPSSVIVARQVQFRELGELGERAEPRVGDLAVPNFKVLQVAQVDQFCRWERASSLSECGKDRPAEFLQLLHPRSPRGVILVSRKERRMQLSELGDRGKTIVAHRGAAEIQTSKFPEAFKLLQAGIIDGRLVQRQGL